MNQLRQLQKELKRQCELIAEWLASNAAHNIEDYRFECGRHQAFLTVLSGVNDLVKGEEEEDG